MSDQSMSIEDNQNLAALDSRAESAGKMPGPDPAALERIAAARARAGEWTSE